MLIGVYGSGYLGLVISACLADFGTPVTCYDEDSSRAGAITDGSIPFYEKNLKEVIKRNTRTSRLRYTSDLETFTRRSQVIFLAEHANRYIEDLAVQLARKMQKDGILVITTPVPVGTTRRIDDRIRAEGLSVVLVAHPVSFTDGCAVEDFNWPDRIVLGTASANAVLILKQIYRPVVMRGVPVVVTNFETAELVREASTAFVATKLSFINELSTLCEKVNADAMDLALALGLDKKVGPRCLQPGAGFGGTFVESDMDSLAQLAHGNGVSLKILSAAREVNRALSDRIAEKVVQAVDSVSGKELGILGLAFKPNTNSVAGSSSILLARRLMSKGAKVRAYDPVAMAEARLELNGTVRYCDDPYAVAEGSEALILGTGWPEFRALDFEKIKRLLKRPVIVDTKNLLDASRLKQMGFTYIGVGRS
jgi:UDPglucose 6-dehydrogenase